MTKNFSRIQSVLIKKNIISQKLFNDAYLKINNKYRAPNSTVNTIQELLNSFILDYGVDHHLIFREISKLYAFKEIKLKVNSISEKTIESIRNMFFEFPEDTRKFLIEKKVIPVTYHPENKNILIFAAANPTDYEIYKVLRSTKICNQFEIRYSKIIDIEELINKVSYYQNEFLTKIEESLQDIEIPDENSVLVDEEALDEEINRSMLTNLIEGTLIEAVRCGASDIHILPTKKNNTEFYFRIDGKLQLWHSQSKVKPESIAAVVKDRSMNIDRFDRAIAQDGYIQRKIEGCFIRFRVSVLPIITSEFSRKFESIVLRVLDDRKIITKLSDLGLQKQAASDFIKAINQPQGMVILTGPTGSGKSTSLVAALYHVMDSTKNIITVEEPVEYMISQTRQIRLNQKLNFDQALRAILRHDPDIVMVGEMRDLKSAKIGISLANTGHLTFSTLHTNDATSAITRLYMLGVEPFLIANAINLIMAQRLVRKLCLKCRKPVKTEEYSNAFKVGFSENEIRNTTFYEAAGCKECYDGYKGRIAIMEALYLNQEISNFILKSTSEIDENAILNLALKNGMITLRESGKERIREGFTTCEEIIAATSEQ